MTDLTGKQRKLNFDPNLANEENKRYENMPASEEKKTLETKVEKVEMCIAYTDRDIVFTGYDKGVIVWDKQSAIITAYTDNGNQLRMRDPPALSIIAGAYHSGLTIKFQDKLIFADDKGQKKEYGIPDAIACFFYKNGAMTIEGNGATLISNKPDGTRTNILVPGSPVDVLKCSELEDRGILYVTDEGYIRSLNDDGTRDIFYSPEQLGPKPKLKYYRNGIIVKNGNYVFCDKSRPDVAEIMHKDTTNTFGFGVYDNGCLILDKDKLIAIDEDLNKIELCTLGKDETFLGYKSGAIVVKTSIGANIYTAYKIK
jgi:hypothetical protein